MKARLYIVLCIAFITQMAGVLPLQAGHYYYKQISLKEGLPSTVRCILTDEQGFVWIGTRSGLGRFDGHELKKYIIMQTIRIRCLTTSSFRLQKTNNTISGS